MYSVIMGDIITSKSIDDSDKEEIANSAKNTLTAINVEYFDYLISSLGLVRGDAFEGVLFSQAILPKIIKKIIKDFYRNKETKLRISVTIGSLAVISSDRNESNGDSFYQATDEIERLKKLKSNHWFQISFLTNSIAQPIITSLFLLLSGITEKWTKRQREIVWEMEDLYDNINLVSKKMKIPVSVIKKQLKAADYEAYQSAWNSLEQYLTDLEESIVEGWRDEKSYTHYYSVAQRKIKQCLFKEAISLLEKSLKLAENEFDKEDPKISNIYNSLARALIEQKDFGRAEQYINKSLDLQSCLPTARLEYAKTISILGDLYLLRDSYINDQDICLAEKYYVRAIEVAIITVGENHLFVRELYNSIAATYKYRGEYNTALSYYLKTLLLFNINPNNLLEFGTTNYNAAICYSEIFDYKNAVIYVNEAERIFKELLPVKHEYIINAKRLANECRSKEGKTT